MLCALAATQTARGANYEFTGEVDNKWGTAGNWRVASAGAQQSDVPNGGHNLNFWPSTKMAPSFADNPFVEINGEYSTTWKLHVRNFGTEAAPVVFRADTDEHGVTAGNANSGDNTGYYIAYDTGDAWLRLEKGTYKTGSAGYWFIGSSDYVGNVIACDGVKMDCGYRFQMRYGTFSATNTALTVNNACYFGCQSGRSVTVYKRGGVWTMNGTMHVGHNGGATMVQDGGTIEAKSNLFVGNPGEGSLTINSGSLNVASGKITYIGRNGADGQGTLTVNGGTANLGGDLVLGDKGDKTAGGTGTLIVNGGTVEVNSSNGTKSGIGTGTINLEGGTFKTKYCRDDQSGGSLTINFNGGTLQANAVQSDGLLYHKSGTGINVYVGANGGTIHTGGFGISIPVAINDASDSSGAMTFAGGGTVTISGAVGWTGGTTITNSTILSIASADNVANILTNGLSVAIPAGGVPVGTVVLTFTGAGAINPAWLGANDIVIGDAADIADLYLGISADGKSVIVKSSAVRPFVWIGNANDNWTDSGKWDDGNGPTAWEDGSKAIFNTSGASTVVNAAVAAPEIVFQANATVGGTANLTVETVAVSNGVSAAINAPTTGTLAKTGEGTLVLGANRTERTIVDEGALAMSGATVDSSKLTLGVYAAKPVVFDYGGQTLSGKWTDYLAAGMDITLTNGTFSTTQNPTWKVATMPKSLTIAKGAVMTTSERFTWNMCGTSDADATNYVDIVGGTLASTETGDPRNWIMQDSRRGTLVFNVSDGGLLQFANRVYMLPCRDKTTENDTPGLLLTFNDSTFQVKNNHNLLLGHDDGGPGNRKNPKEPIFELAMTNSVLDVGKGGIYLGHNERQSNTAGHATADFESCVVTAKEFGVYMDRPANGARFNNSTLVLTDNNSGTGAGSGWILATNDAPVIVVGPGGLVLDSQGYTGNIRADFGGTGAVTKKGPGKITLFRSQTSTAAFVCEEGETIVEAGLSVSRAVTAKSGTGLTVKGSAKVSFASLTLEDGATLNIDTPTFGVPSMAVGALALPTSGSATLTINGGTPAMGRYAIFEKEGIAIADVQDKLVPSAGTWEVSDNTLYLVVKGENDIFWTGAGDGARLSDGENWLGGSVPSSEQNAVISVSSGVTLVCDSDFSPSSITFAANSTAATISGDGSIAGVTSITNLSPVSHTINVPVYFAGNIQVTQNADYYDHISRSHIVFAGGAYPAAGKSIETGATVNWSRCMFGDYYLDSAANARWTATQYSNCRPAVADDSMLYVQYAGRLTELHVGSNAKAFVGDMALDGGRLSYRVLGEMVVTNLTLTGTSDRYLSYGQGTSTPGTFKINSITNGMTGGWFYFADGNAAAKHTVYIGEGGLNFATDNAIYCIGRGSGNNAETIRPWYSDFTIAARSDNGRALVFSRDITFCTDDESGVGRTITIDANTWDYSSPVIAVSGTGTLRVNSECYGDAQPPVTVTDTATLAFKPGASLTTSNITVNAGATLAVAESGTLGLGCDLVLGDNACLGFNYTSSATPILDLTGKDVAFDEGETTNVVVKISAENGARASYNDGRNVLTAGQKFAGVNVSLYDGPGRPEWVIDVKEEDGEIVAYIKSIGLMLFVR
jgi:hypothetical protein